jgi:nicotinate-nucleotide adenylyltransferase
LDLSLSTPERIGLYGGAFDPPHLAHEALAQAAVQQYGLSRLIVMPTGLAWHKSRTLTAPVHRIEMAKLAFADVPGAQIDARETQRSGATYTFDTLMQLRAEFPSAELFLLMGQDQLNFFPQWHRYAEILQNATLLVASRADSMPATGQKDLKNTVKIPYLTISMPPMPTSASAIRAHVASGQRIDHLVKPAVARYIAEHRLYLSP